MWICEKGYSCVDPCDDCDHYIEVVAVVHGYWKACVDEYEICATEFTCSCCKESFISSDLTDQQFLEMMKYCPNCGALMDGEDGVGE